jgi:hypothetical protein
MGEASDAIERHIRETRGELERNVEELEFRVKRATDWKQQVSKRPLGAVTAAFTGGLLASMLFGSADHHSNGRKDSYRGEAGTRKPKLRRAVGSLQSALLAMASMELKSFLRKSLVASRSRAESQPRAGSGSVGSL